VNKLEIEMKKFGIVAVIVVGCLGLIVGFQNCAPQQGDTAATATSQSCVSTSKLKMSNMPSKSFYVALGSTNTPFYCSNYSNYTYVAYDAEKQTFTLAGASSNIVLPLMRTSNDSCGKPPAPYPDTDIWGIENSATGGVLATISKATTLEFYFYYPYAAGGPGGFPSVPASFPAGSISNYAGSISAPAGYVSGTNNLAGSINCTILK
jgi:hypothetical protein